MLASQHHTCARTTTGTLLCWGHNQFGQVGAGEVDTYAIDPLVVEPAGQWAELARSVASFHTCAIDLDGSMWCWGNNDCGQLGDGTTEERERPVKIGDDRDWQSVALDMHTTFAVKRDNTLWSWGRTMDADTCGVTPTLFDETPRWQSVVGGFNQFCAIDVHEKLWCWGLNTAGELGDGTCENRLVPTPVDSDSTWKMVAVGDIHTCGIDSQDRLQCWGGNTYGELGDGEGFSPVPLRITLP